MSNKTINRAGISQDVLVALGKKPDYSSKFTHELMILQAILADALSAPVEHDADMNYSSAQQLVLWLDGKCHTVKPRDPKAAFRLVDLVSSKGRFFTFVTLGLSASTAGWKEKGLEKPRRYWSLISKDDLPDGIKKVRKKVTALMESSCYTLLDEDVLSQQATGHLTQMDGRAATVFEALFTEMY